MAAKEADGPEEERIDGADAGEQSLGEALVSARERRRLSAPEAAEQTRIPAHYVKMLEASDYRLISDQLYLLPFLRKYASFLELDADEMAMRFVREVQAAERYPVKLPDPPAVPRTRRSGWLTSAAIALFVVIALYWAGVGRHHAVAASSRGVKAASEPPPVAQPATGGQAVAAAPALVPAGDTNPGAQAATDQDPPGGGSPPAH